MTDTQKKTEHSLNDLIAISRDGQEFYQEAAQKVEDAELATLFRRMAAVKAEVVTALAQVVQASGGTPEQEGTLAGSIRQGYTKVRAALGDRRYAYVAELEETEDRLLHAFDEVFQERVAPGAQSGRGC